MDRLCLTCGVIKPSSEFLTRSDTGKVKTRCRSCENEWHRKNYENSKAKKSAQQKTYYSRPEIKAQRKAYRDARKIKDKLWKKNWDLRRHYGIDLPAFEATVEAQRNCCPICSEYFPTGSRMWHVDHDHVTGDVRGVICQRCNFMLGQAKDKPEVLRAGADYLEKIK